MFYVLVYRRMAIHGGAPALTLYGGMPSSTANAPAKYGGEPGAESEAVTASGRAPGPGVTRAARYTRHGVRNSVMPTHGR